MKTQGHWICPICDTPVIINMAVGAHWGSDGRRCKTSFLEHEKTDGWVQYMGDPIDRLIEAVSDSVT